MRQLILLGLMAATALPAWAAKRVTVTQLEQKLTAVSAEHKPDPEVARLIAGMELSERLTEATLARLNAHLNPGSQPTVALQLLADQSAFLDPPASELPTTPVPDNATQQRMLETARNYVAQTMPRLPNFLATRSTNRFDDSARELKKDGWLVHAGLHQVDTSSSEISVRDEQENQPTTKGSALWQEQSGLISKGEFGSTLGMILADTAKGKVTWSHWEQIAGDQVAVFRYSVPRSTSNYEVMSPNQQHNEEYTNLTGGRGMAGIGVQLSDNQSKTSFKITRPGYHGSLWLDPATGTILRTTIQADAKDGSPFRLAAILVQYGPVQIGDKTFICPIRSVSLYEAVTDAKVSLSDAPTEWLNITLFTGYHRFASTAQILPDTAVPQ
jgi:hypothetical protein